MFLVQLLNGITWSAILFLMASGFYMLFGLMRIINMAHGSFYMFAGYITAALTLAVGFWIGLLVGVVSIAIIGVLIYVGLLKSLHKQDLKQLLLTFGLIYVFLDITQWLWHGQVLFPFKPDILDGSARFLGIIYPIYQLVIIAIVIIIGAALWFIQDKTKLGAIIRAGVDDEEMVRGLGINLAPIFLGAFALGAALAGFAGGMGAVFTGAYLGIDTEILTLGLIIVVIGGLGSLQGAMLGSLLIGLADTLGKAYLPDFASFTIFTVMVLVLVFRPSGLLGKQT